MEKCGESVYFKFEDYMQDIIWGTANKSLVGYC